MFETILFQHIDAIAEEILKLTKNNLDIDNKNLLIALIQQKINKIRFLTINDEIIKKINYLENELKSIKKGSSINIGVMSDMRFTSMFYKYGSKTINNITANKSSNSGLDVCISNITTTNKDYIEKVLIS